MGDRPDCRLGNARLRKAAVRWAVVSLVNMATSVCPHTIKVDFTPRAERRFQLLTGAAPVAGWLRALRLGGSIALTAPPAGMAGFAPSDPCYLQRIWESARRLSGCRTRRVS